MFYCSNAKVLCDLHYLYELLLSVFQVYQQIVDDFLGHNPHCSIDSALKLLQFTYRSLKDLILYISQRKKSGSVRSGDLGGQITGKFFLPSSLRIALVKVQAYLDLHVLVYGIVRLKHFQEIFDVRF